MWLWLVVLASVLVKVSGEADRCSTFLRPLECGILANDTSRVQYSSTCPLPNASAVGSEVPFNAFWLDARGPLTHCQLSTERRTYAIPDWLSKSLTVVHTLSSFVSGADYRHEAFIIAQTVDGEEYRIGSMVPRVNTLVGTENRLANAEGLPYPFNGQALCNGAVSAQRWPIPATLSEMGVVAIHIEDPRAALRTFAFTVDNCTAAQDVVPSASVSLNSTVSVDVTSQFAVTSQVASWPLCALAAAQAGGEGFVFTPSVGRCAVLGTLRAAVRSEVSSPPTAFGVVSTSIEVVAEPVAIPGRVPTAMDRWSILRSDLYGDMSARLFIFSNASGRSPLPRIALRIEGMSKFAVAAAQMSLPTQSIISVATLSRVHTCGMPSGGQLERVSPYYNKNNINNSFCDEFSYCPPQGHQMYTGPVMVDFSTWPNRTNCGYQAALLLFYTDGAIGGSDYSYVWYTATQYVSVAAAKASLATRHEVASIYRYESYATSQGYIHTYNIGGPERLPTSPEWKMTDVNGRTVNTTLWCDAYDIPHYKASYRSTGGSGYDCDNFSSIEEVTGACSSDPNCFGFTTVQNGTGFELPGCLLADVSTTSASETENLFVKAGNRPSCVFPAAGGIRVSVRVTSSVSSATTYRILADGQQVGSCTNLPTTDTSSASCFTTFDCFTGDLPDGTVSVEVIGALPMDPERRCPRATMSVAVSFDAEYTYYSPAASCLTALSLLPDCTATSVTDPCGGNARLRSGISIPTAGCVVPESGLRSAEIVGEFVGIVTIVDTTGMSGDDVSAGAVQVHVETSDGSLALLGHIAQRPDGSLRHFAIDQTPVDSYGLCVGSGLPSSGHAHYFPIPLGLRRKGLARVWVRGVGASVVSLSLASAGCEATNPQKTSDVMFGFTSWGLMASGPEVADPVNTDDVTACATTCFGTLKCFVYTYRRGICSLHNAYGLATTVDGGSISGGRILPSAALADYPTGQPAPQHMAGAIDVLSPYGNVYAFVTHSDNSLRLLVQGGQRVRAIVSTGGLTSSSVVGVATVGVGGALLCGSQYAAWEGSTTLPGQCSTLAACPELNTRAVFNQHVQLTWHGVDGSACQGTVWGAIGTSGSIGGGAQYFGVRLGLPGDSPVTGVVGAVAVGTRILRVDGQAYGVTLIEQYGTASARVVSTNVPVLCTIVHKVIFVVRRLSTPLTVGECGSEVSVDSAMLQCEASSGCRGISVDSSNGAFLCFATSAGTNTSGTEHFLEKVVETSCSFTLQVPGMLRISIAQLRLNHLDGNDARVYINERLIGRCGYSEPFIAGFVEDTLDNCSSYWSCVNELVPETGTIRVELPESSIQCDGHYGSVLVELQPAAFESRNLHRGASTMAYRRTIHTSQPTEYSFLVSGISQSAVLVRQDRYRCGVGCEIPFQLNLTVGIASQRLCGGLSGFEDGNGLDGACSTYYYCGTTSGGNPVSFTPVTTLLSFKVLEAYRHTTACDQLFYSTAFSNGIMLAADATHYATRTMFAKRYTGPTSTSPASVAGDLRPYAIGAHMGMPETSITSSLKYYDKLFPAFTNHLQVSSGGFLLYDFAKVNEADKVVHEGTYACIGDKQSIDGRAVVCQMRFSTNYVSVVVAQTKFDTIADTITVHAGNLTKICGGDRTFFGYRGTLDECDRYYTCFEGYIDPGDVVTITYSDSVIQNSRCRPSAVAFVTGSTRPPVPDLVCEEASAPFKCYPSRQCLTMEQICDRFVNCPDQSDEADCTTWRYVASNVVPTCSPSAFHSTDSLDQCRRYAVADPLRPNVLVYNRSGCFTFTCVVFSDPKLQELSSGDSELHALVIRPSDFAYCSNSLHCSGHGVVLSTAAPCVCSCDATYVGDDCSSVSTPALSRDLIVVFERNTSITEEVILAVERAVLGQLPALHTVVVTAYEDREGLTGVVVQVRNSVNDLVTSDLLVGLLVPSSQRRILRTVSLYGGQYVTATQPATPRMQYFCGRASGGVPYTCSGNLRASINSTRSLTLSLPGLALTDATQWVDITLTGAGGSGSRGSGGARRSSTRRCTMATAVTSADFSQPLSCQQRTVCMFPFEEEIIGANHILIQASPTLDFSSSACNGALSATVDVDGMVFFEDDTSKVYNPTTSTNHNLAYLYAFFALLCIGIICLVILVTWCRLRKRYPKAIAVGPVAGGLSLFLITFSIVLLTYYFDSKANEYSHSLIIEDYRDPLCDGSPYAPIPIRAALVPGNGRCEEVTFVGQREETVYIAAKLTSNREFPVQMKIGSSMSACDTTAWRPVYTHQCLVESDYMPAKSEGDFQYFMVRGMSNRMAARRLAAIREYNPTEPTSIDVPVAILPPEHRYLSTRGKLTFQFKGMSYAMEPPQTHPLPLMASTPSDPYLQANVMPYEEVRFKQTIWAKSSATDKGSYRVINDAPLVTSDSYANYGTLFDTALTRSDPNAYIGTEGGGSNAFTFSGVAGGPLDLSKRTSDFTLTMWVRCPTSARGVAFATMDGWLEEDYTSPIIERLIATVENGALGPDWFSSWRVGSALYLNGGSGRVVLASATPEDGVQMLSWNAQDLGVGRLFDGTWHFLAFVVSADKYGEMRVRLFVDGESHGRGDGWTACAKNFFKPLSSVSTSQIVSVTTQRAIVTPDGVLGVGYFSGGLFALTVHDTAMNQQQIFQLGAEGMRYYSDILMAESLALGICTAVITAIMVLYSIYIAFRNEFGVNEDAFEEEAIYDERGHRVRQDTEIRETKGSIFTSSVSFVNFISPVILLFQIITLFLQSFEWPESYYDSFYVLAAFSLDLDAFGIKAPVILWPVLQFVMALALFALMIVVAGVDKTRFITVTEMYREKVKVRQLENRSRQRRIEDVVEMIDLPKPNYQWVVHAKEGTRPLNIDQQDLLLRSLQEILLQRARRETNMRVFTKNLVNMGELGEGIILYERIAGNVYISLRTSPNTLEHDQQADVIDMRQTYFEQICDNVMCPEHKLRLLPDDLHVSNCVHSGNPYYRSKECPRKCIMYVCPDEHCEYAVCEFCYAASGAGAVSGAVSDALKRLQSVREAGIIQSFGSVIALLWSIIYIPAVKNALMIISCHSRYRCEFDNCWQNPSAYYMFMVLFSVLILTCIAVGYIFIEVWILHFRREEILKMLPQQTRRPRNKVYDFIMPKKSVNRGDYNDFLDEDKSILCSFYTSFEFDYFYASPALVFYRLCLVISVAVTPEGSLTQVGLSSAVSLLFALLLVALSMYKNVWVEVLVRLGAIHILVQLALMALHRVDIRNNVFSSGYDDQMVATTYLYIGIVGLLWLITVVVPFIRKQWAHHIRRRKQRRNINEQIYDIGFWGEIRTYAGR